MSVVAKVWMPPGSNCLSCRDCGKSITSGEVYITEDWQMSNNPVASCIRCGFASVLAAIIAGPTMNDHTIKRALAEMCKLPVREELHKIIREECADPNGPISPGTDTSRP
jgi:hypothetical protein